MSSNDINASVYFNANWQPYKDSVKKNMLFHKEMFLALNQFLKQNMEGRDFSFVDVGCGDCSSIEPVLIDKPITKYIGIDAAEDVLKMASSNLAKLSCDKKFISEDMTTAINRLSSPVDLIFTSYAVHHLSSQQKFDFILNCKNKLTPNGFLLMVDGVREKNQTRDEWLNALEARFKLIHPEMTDDELINRMGHPRADDFPEEISVLDSIANKQGWSNFQVVVDKGICAFMVFSK